MRPEQPRILSMRNGYNPILGAELIKILRDGGIVVLPTDTVYGIAVDAHLPEAVELLYAVKGRETNKPIPLLAADRTDVERWGATLTRIDRCLANLFWPGPLTIVLRVGDVYEGFRVPDFGITRTILREAGGVLRVTSANRSGEPPALTAEEALRAIGFGVAAVVDAGPAPGGVASTVVKVEEGQVRILREGAIFGSRILELCAELPSREELTLISPPLPPRNDSKRKLIVFVCTGNVCRSPMAEYLFRTKMGNDSEWDATSAGILAGTGLPPSEAAVTVMSEIGIDLSSHRSRPFTHELANAAELIVVMTSSQREQIRALFPDAGGKVRLLKSFGTASEGDIDDPIGLPVEVYRAVRNEINASLDTLVADLRTKSNCN
ncbi:MAG: L-threonylcarbamoyladenylate synthase [Kiritimatiellia bacterium]